MKIVAVVPVKGTSERIENKNIKLLDGKPLFLHTIEKLLSCNFLDEVYLDTESDKIIDIVSDYKKLKIFKRDPSLANNKTDGHKLFYNEVKNIEADIYVQILCTSPFIKKETIKKGIEILKEKEYDSVVLVKKDKQYLWGDDFKPLYSTNKIPNSVDLPDTIIETMGMYIMKKEAVLETQKRYNENVYLLEAEAVEGIDVNYPEEFKLANYIAAGIREEERKLFKNLAYSINSSILSDIADDLGLNTFIGGLELNLKTHKIFGRANTLKLRKMKEGEDYRGIYEAYASYERIVSNDVIVVENECRENAYFGEMNANLALRSGAVAAIIDGVTRDRNEVERINFPTFSEGGIAQDVRRRAVVESINKKITIKGVEIYPGDLIYGDRDGIVVIPKKYEKEILKRVVASIEKEKKVLFNITANTSTDEILDKVGEF